MITAEDVLSKDVEHVVKSRKAFPTPELRRVYIDLTNDDYCASCNSDHTRKDLYNRISMAYHNQKFMTPSKYRFKAGEPQPINISSLQLKKVSDITLTDAIAERMIAAGYGDRIELINPVSIEKEGDDLLVENKSSKRKNK